MYQLRFASRLAAYTTSTVGDVGTTDYRIFFKDGDKTMMGVQDPSKLIDLELVNLLKFCNDLKKKHKETDDY
jgi:hypothetical protein